MPPTWPAVAAAMASAPLHGSDCARFEDCPVAAELRPVQWSYASRYHALVREWTTGKHGSPVFVGVLSRADVHWALLAKSGRGLVFGPDDAQAWLDTAAAASILGFSATLDETFARAPKLAAIRAAGDMLIDPSLDIEVGKDGKVTAAHRVAPDARQEVARREVEAGYDARMPRPRASAGFGWRLREPDAPEEAALLQWGAYLQLSRMGITSLRAEVGAPGPTWTLTAGQSVSAGVRVTGGVASAEKSGEANQWSVGANWALPAPLRPWTLRLDRVTTLAREEVTWRLGARCDLGAHLPGRLRPSLAPWPEVAERGPLQLGKLAVSPALLPPPPPARPEGDLEPISASGGRP
jgi:hypothetical protein